DPGMHIPAAKSTEVAIKANLNSGLNIGTAKTPIYALDSVHGYNVKDGTTKDENDTGITQFYTTSKNSVEVTEKGVDCASLFNGSGTGLNLREGQGIWVSYADAKFSTQGGNKFDENNLSEQQNVIFWGHKDKTVKLDITLNGVHIQNSDIKSLDEAIQFINTYTVPQDSRPGTGVKAVKNKEGTGIDFVNTNADGTTDNMKNIDLKVNDGNTAGELTTVKVKDEGDSKVFDWDNVTLKPVNGDTAKTHWIKDNNVKNSIHVVTAHKYIYTSSPVDLDPMYNPDGGKGYDAGKADTPGTAENNYKLATQGGLLTTTERTFHTTEDLRELLQRDARYGVDYDGSGGFEADGSDINEGVKVTVSASGEFIISNPNEIPSRPGFTPGAGDNRKPHNINFNITSYTDSLGKVSTNEAFTNIFKGFDGNLNVGNSNRKSEQLFLS
ncbi:flagellar hook protein FlgE, partial [Campylobacter sp. RM13744]|nr:flagellar hook protein FlgE [Campylobacter sp. RM13744]